jgi:PAS domain-containing protein
MQTYERNIQERLGSALHTLAFIEQRASTAPDPRRMQTLLKQVRQLVADLEHGFSLLQEATGQHAELRQQVEAASMRAGLLFDISPVPCLVLHETGTIADANTAATRLLNTSSRYLQDKPFELFLGADRDTFLAWLSAVSRGTGSQRRSVLLRPREQRAKQVALIAAPETEGRVTIVVVGAAEAEELAEVAAQAGETIV